MGLKPANRPTGDFNLEADDISVLDPTLGEGALRPHELNHARFDFLGEDKNQRIVSVKMCHSEPHRVSVVSKMATSSSR